MTLTITSNVFEHAGPIPRKYTCDGDDISPPLNWNGVPDGARSLVLIVDDPDAPDPAAPQRIWVHWVLYNLPVESTGVPEAAAKGELPTGTRVARNDWNKAKYGGPCPPIGEHRYFHKLYALDTELPDLGNATKADVEQAMAGHVLAQAELIGTYQRDK